MHSRVKKIYQIDNYHFGIDWVDGEQGKWKLYDLRRACPCAGCQEKEGISIKDDITCTKIISVGRYALNIIFTDGHKSGIYSFSFLKELSKKKEA